MNPTSPDQRNDSKQLSSFRLMLEIHRNPKRELSNQSFLQAQCRSIASQVLPFRTRREQLGKALFVPPRREFRHKKLSTAAASPTGLLLLQGQLLPVALHAVAQGHPEIGLLLERHSLPSLLDVAEGRVGQGLGGHGAGRQPGALRQGIASQDHGAKHFGRWGFDELRRRFNWEDVAASFVCRWLFGG